MDGMGWGGTFVMPGLSAKGGVLVSVIMTVSVCRNGTQIIGINCVLVIGGAAGLLRQ